MQNSKLHDLFLALTPAERQKMTAFLEVESARDDVKTLYNFLLKNNDKNENCDMDKNNIFKILYGDVLYNDNWLRHAQSFLIGHIEAFLVYRALRKKAVESGLLLAEVLQQRKLKKPFEQSFLALRKSVAQSKLKDINTLKTEEKIAKQWFFLAQQQNETDVPLLQTALFAHEKAVVAERLRLVCTALSYQNRYKINYDFGNLQGVLQTIETQKWQETEPAIGAYYYIYQLNTAENTTDFWTAFREKLPDYRPFFEHDEYQTLYIGAINYVIRVCNSGDKSFFRAMFELYKYGIEQHILWDAGKELSAYTYKNTVAAGLRIGETDYIFSFLEKYKENLPKAQRENYYEYNLARYYFTINDLAKATPLLQKLTYGDVFLQLDAKVMLLKLLYKNDDFDGLELHLRAFRQFLQRKKAVLGYHQQNYENILHCIKQLMEANLLDKKTLADLRHDFQNLHPLTEREWLLLCLD
jgi:hypothetical protein